MCIANAKAYDGFAQFAYVVSDPLNDCLNGKKYEY